jgi:hypothetical protein
VGIRIDGRCDFEIAHEPRLKVLKQAGASAELKV